MIFFGNLIIEILSEIGRYLVDILVVSNPLFSHTLFAKYDMIFWFKNYKLYGKKSGDFQPMH